MPKCGCKLEDSKSHHHGGSLASTNVVEFVPCDAWGKMEATNVFGGGGDNSMGDFRIVLEGGKKKPSKPRWRKIVTPKRQRGGSDGSCGSTSLTPTFLSATGSPPAMSIPASQTSALFDYSGVGQSVFATLQSQAVAGNIPASYVYFPQGAATIGTQLYP
jgi:hypothetical protein